MQRGEVIYENYPNSGARESGWELASGTKSFTGLMAAAAVQDGLLSLDERVAETIPAWRSDARKARITLRHLLSLTSGLEVRGIGRPPTYEDVLEFPAQHEPGARFEYGPAPFQIFGEVLRRKISPRDRDPQTYLQRRVLNALNIAPTRWRRGGDGMPLMPQGAHFTARAWGAYGQCVMEGGRGLVDEDALRACFEGSSANPGYGLSWWLLRPGLVPPSPRAGVAALDDLREDVRMAAGAGDQRLYLIPRRELVIVRQANQILRGMRARGDDRWNDAVFLRFFAGL
jgi:CubicO group peptidase (beta-lactamase class C family)